MANGVRTALACTEVDLRFLGVLHFLSWVYSLKFLLELCLYDLCISVWWSHFKWGRARTNSISGVDNGETIHKPTTSLKADWLATLALSGEDFWNLTLKC